MRMAVLAADGRRPRSGPGGKNHLTYGAPLGNLETS